MSGKKSILAFRADIIKYGLSLDPYTSNLTSLYQYANGCGAKDGIDVPDTIWGVDVSSACHVHDIMWMQAECYPDLIAANNEFVVNLKKICDLESNTFTGYFRRLRIATYSYGVDEFGTRDYAIERGFIDASGNLV